MSTSTRNKAPKAAAEANDVQTVWIWAAAIAAWLVAEEGVTAWNDFGAMTEAARFYHVRACDLDARRSNTPQPASAVERLRSAIRQDDDLDEFFDQPAGFTSWRVLAERYFERLDLDPDVSGLEVGQKVTWSVCHLVLATDPKDPLFQKGRSDRRPPDSLIQSVRALRGVLKPVAAVIRDGALVVADGRQRVGAVRKVCERELYRYYEELRQIIGGIEPQRHLIDEPRSVDDIEPPRLVFGVPCVIHRLENGVLIKNLANQVGLEESLMDQARAVWELYEEFGSAPVVARMRGMSDQTVYNLVSLQKLEDAWLTLLEGEKLSAKVAYRLARETRERQTKCAKAFATAKKSDWRLDLGKADKWVESWLEGRDPAAVEVKAVAPKEKAKRWDALERLRNELRQICDEDPAARAVLQVLDALDTGYEASRQLPVRWRVALEDSWGEDECRAGWNAIGVWDPVTADMLMEYLPPMEEGNMLNLDNALALERAGRIWRDGITIGAAYEGGLLTDHDELERLMSEGHELIDRRDLGHSTPVLEEHRAAAGAPSSSREPPRKRWGTFSGPDQTAWQRVGVQTLAKAKQLRAAGYVPGFLGEKFGEGLLVGLEPPARAIAVLGPDEVLSRTLAEMFEAGVLDLGELATIYREATPACGVVAEPTEVELEAVAPREQLELQEAARA